MLSGNWIRITVGLVAAIYLALLTLLEASARSIVLGYYGFVVATLSLLFLFFDKYLWRIWGVRWVVDKLGGNPVLHGTWKGVLHSCAVSHPIEAYLIVRQTFTSIYVQFVTENSPSESLATELVRKAGGRYELHYIYQNTPPSLSLAASPMHYGGTILDVQGNNPVKTLKGSYWTNRGTKGEIQLDKHSSNIYSSFEEARKGTYS